MARGSHLLALMYIDISHMQHAACMTERTLQSVLRLYSAVHEID